MTEKTASKSYSRNVQTRTKWAAVNKIIRVEEEEALKRGENSLFFLGNILQRRSLSSHESKKILPDKLTSMFEAQNPNIRENSLHFLHGNKKVDKWKYLIAKNHLFLEVKRVKNGNADS